MILREGLHYNVHEHVYHSDPAPEPSLSNSIAGVLLSRSPLHARHQHPRLNPEPAEPREVTSAMDFGSALHKTILGRGAEIEVIDFEDYKKQAARDERDQSRADGRIPLLTASYERMCKAAEAALKQMREHPDCQDFFAPGHSEVVAIWREGQVWMRSMIDRLPDDPKAPAYDLKSTDLSASPESWDSRMVKAYRTQGPFYGRGLKALRKVQSSPMRFVVVESKMPHAISVMTSAPSLYHVGSQDVERAIATWAQCIKSGEWPSYPKYTAHIEAPVWLLNAETDRLMRDEYADESA